MAFSVVETFLITVTQKINIRRTANNKTARIEIYVVEGKEEEVYNEPHTTYST